MAIDIRTLDTFPKLLAHHAQVSGRLPAIREKHLDVWQTWDRARLAAEVRVLAGGLAFPIRSTTAKSQATASILHFCSLTTCSWSSATAKPISAFWVGKAISAATASW